MNRSPEVPEMVLGDRHRIEHVVTNFLSNAINFSPDDSEVVVDVSLETERSIIYFMHSKPFAW